MHDETNHDGTRHEVETFERGATPEGHRGFAARCLEPTCGEITFGGFATRTAARLALAGHAAPARKTETNGDDVA